MGHACSTIPGAVVLAEVWWGLHCNWTLLCLLLLPPLLTTNTLKAKQSQYLLLETPNCDNLSKQKEYTLFNSSLLLLNV